MKYLIGIASYKRPENQRTLAYLEDIGVDKDRIIFSVQTQEDEKAYTRAGVKDRVGKFLYRPGKNASQNRNTILDSVKPGERVVLLDDDITEISRLRKDRLAPVDTLEKFEAMLADGYRQAAKYHTSVWGVYPVHDAFFMKEACRSRNIIDATLMAVVNTDLRFDPSVDTKEDFKYSCDAIRRFGSSVRLDYYACKAQHHSAGGCEEFWKDKEATYMEAKKLAGAYPDIIEMNPRRKGEVKMTGGRNGNSNRKGQRPKTRGV